MCHSILHMKLYPAATSPEVQSLRKNMLLLFQRWKITPQYSAGGHPKVHEIMRICTSTLKHKEKENYERQASLRSIADSYSDVEIRICNIMQALLFSPERRGRTIMKLSCSKQGENNYEATSTWNIMQALLFSPERRGRPRVRKILRICISTLK